MDNGRKECTCLWFIENYSYCSYKNGSPLCSPNFTFGELEGTTWYLVLYPRGSTDENRGNISLFLRRKRNGACPDDLTINFEFSLLAADGLALHSEELECIFRMSSRNGFCQFVQTDEINLRRKREYLPNDTLTVRCRMWIGEGNVQKVEQISARTRIFPEQLSFQYTVENFSSLQPNVKKTIKIHSPLVEGSVISSSLYYTDGSCCDKKIIIEILPSDARQILHKCKLFLIDADKNIIECGGIDYTYNAERISIHKLPLTLTRQDVLNRKDVYLPNDKFSLLCECTFSTGLRFHTEKARHELPFSVTKQKQNHVDDKDSYNDAEKISVYTSALEDMKAFYISQRLTDVELKTKTKSFPAHKIVLCSRSPVIEAMMTIDMKEKNTGCIQVDDLENDTVEQLLLFLYSDSIVNLQWKSATQLYYAADKYQIGKLKATCSSFLVKNLSTSTTSELLLLADTHNDSYLMKVVEDFILKHEEQVYCSNGWKMLKERNPQLALKTMSLKYERKDEINEIHFLMMNGIYSV